MKDEKHYCDECGTEMHRWVNVAVFVSSTGFTFPSKFSFENFGKTPFYYKEIYQRELCYDCIGEKVHECWRGEGGGDFALLDKARGFLIKHGLLKAKQS